MRRLIADHFRRWWWVMALGAAYATVLGWCVALPPDYSQHARGTHIFWPVWLDVQGRMFVPNSLFLATWMGAILLTFDLQRGLGRAVRALPMTSRQIGRGWWFATTGLPAIMSIALLLLGAGSFYAFHPDTSTPFSVTRLAWAGIFTLLWFGTGFTINLNKSIGSGFGPTRHAVLLNLFTISLVIWMCFGFALSVNAINNPVKCGVFMLAGALMTAIGWSRAAKFDVKTIGEPGWGRSMQFLNGVGGSALLPLASKKTSDVAGELESPGAISFLIRSTFTRIFFIVITVIVYAGVMFRLQGIVHSWEEAVRYIGGMGAVFWTLIFVQITPILRHLRCLRALPISTNRLAVVLMTLGLVPLLALGALVAGAAWLISGPEGGITVLGGYAFTLAPAALCICFGVWRGGGLLSFAFLLAILIGAFALSRSEVPVPLSGLIIVVSLALGFVLTRRALSCSRRPYLTRGTGLT